MSDKPKYSEPIPKNAEQFQAYQKDIDIERETFVDTLSEEDRLKFDAVKKANQILAEAKVPAYIYALLPRLDISSKDIDPLGFYTEELRKLGMYQYNTFVALLERDERDKLTPQSATLLSYFNLALSNAFVKTQEHYFSGSVKPAIEQVIHSIGMYSFYYHQWATGKGYPPDLQKYIDENGPIFT